MADFSVFLEAGPLPASGGNATFPNVNLAAISIAEQNKISNVNTLRPSEASRTVLAPAKGDITYIINGTPGMYFSARFLRNGATATLMRFTCHTAIMPGSTPPQEPRPIIENFSATSSSPEEANRKLSAALAAYDKTKAEAAENLTFPPYAKTAGVTMIARGSSTEFPNGLQSIYLSHVWSGNLLTSFSEAPRGSGPAFVFDNDDVISVCGVVHSRMLRAPESIQEGILTARIFAAINVNAGGVNYIVAAGSPRATLNNAYTPASGSPLQILINTDATLISNAITAKPSIMKYFGSGGLAASLTVGGGRSFTPVAVSCGEVIQIFSITPANTPEYVGKTQYAAAAATLEANAIIEELSLYQSINQRLTPGEVARYELSTLAYSVDASLLVTMLSTVVYNTITSAVPSVPVNIHKRRCKQLRIFSLKSVKYSTERSFSLGNFSIETNIVKRPVSEISIQNKLINRTANINPNTSFVQANLAIQGNFLTTVSVYDSDFDNAHIYKESKGVNRYVIECYTYVLTSPNRDDIEKAKALAYKAGSADVAVPTARPFWVKVFSKEVTVDSISEQFFSSQQISAARVYQYSLAAASRSGRRIAYITGVYGGKSAGSNLKVKFSVVTYIPSPNRIDVNDPLIPPSEKVGQEPKWVEEEFVVFLAVRGSNAEGAPPVVRSIRFMDGEGMVAAVDTIYDNVAFYPSRSFGVPNSKVISGPSIITLPNKRNVTIPPIEDDSYADPSSRLFQSSTAVGGSSEPLSAATKVSRIKPPRFNSDNALEGTCGAIYLNSDPALADGYKGITGPVPTVREMRILFKTAAEPDVDKFTIRES